MTSQWAADTIGRAEDDAKARLTGLSRGLCSRKQFDIDFAAAPVEDASRKTRQEFRREILLNDARVTSVRRPSPLVLDASMPWGSVVVKELRVLGRNKASREKILTRLFQELDVAKAGFVDSNAIFALATARRLPGQNKGFWPEAADRTRWETMRPLLTQLDTAEDGGILKQADFVAVLNKAIPTSMEHFDAIAAGFLEISHALQLAALPT